MITKRDIRHLLHRRQQVSVAEHTWVADIRILDHIPEEEAHNCRIHLAVVVHRIHGLPAVLGGADGTVAGIVGHRRSNPYST